MPISGIDLTICPNAEIFDSNSSGSVSDLVMIMKLLTAVPAFAVVSFSGEKAVPFSRYSFWHPVRDPIKRTAVKIPKNFGVK